MEGGKMRRLLIRGSTDARGSALKKLFVIIILLFPINLFASPYLTSDCTPVADQVTAFQLQFGTATPIEIATFTICQTEPACGSGQYRICHDLSAMPSGSYSIKALAKNLWGVSPYTDPPLSGTKTLPSSSPLLLRVVK
jgi:hypothetical protein